MQFKNQIFIGPAGCGKKYNLIIETMRILGSELIKPDKNYQYSAEEYALILNEFQNKKSSGEVEMIGFHKSYSYEAFIEEKVYNPHEFSNNLCSVKDGHFKTFVNNALYESIDISQKKLIHYSLLRT